MRGRFGARELLTESVAGIFDRPVRSAFTAGGVVLGIATLVAASGLTATAGNQIVTRLDRAAQTEIVITAATDDKGQVPEGNLEAIPWDAEQRLSKLSGVTGAGSVLELGSVAVTAHPTVVREVQAPVFGASQGLCRAVLCSMAEGHFLDAGNDARRDRVAVVGRSLAARLNVSRTDLGPFVFLNGQGYLMLGVIEDGGRLPELLDGIVVPARTAQQISHAPAPTSVRVDTQPAATRVVALQAPLVLAPTRTNALAVQTADDTEEVRAGVANDVRALLWVLGLITLTISGLGIANIMLIGVLERTSEIGLRRALGGQRPDIAAQFLVESALIGLGGGVVGACLGVLTTIVAAATRSWVLVIDPWVAILGACAGGLIGLIAGAYPSWRAAGIEPIAALRTDQ
jgi:ABC-type lipoprotein release transport system permease subunit